MAKNDAVTLAFRVDHESCVAFESLIASINRRLGKRWETTKSEILRLAIDRAIADGTETVTQRIVDSRMATDR
jgi:hypothetical protein